MRDGLSLLIVFLMLAGCSSVAGAPPGRAPDADTFAPERQSVVIGVAGGEARAQVAAFIAEHNARYAQLVDESYAFADALGQRRVPTTLVVDRAGRVVYAGGRLDERAVAVFRRAMASD